MEYCKGIEILTFIDSFVNEWTMNDKFMNDFKNRISALIYIICIPGYLSSADFENDAKAREVYFDARNIYASKENRNFNKCVDGCLKNLKKRFKNRIIIFNKRGSIAVKDAVKNAFALLKSF